MPLSEHEERILAEIERQLAEDDPRFVARARRTVGGSPRRLVYALVGLVVGILCVLALTFHFVFGVIGIGLMIVSVVAGVTALRQHPARRAAQRDR